MVDVKEGQYYYRRLHNVWKVWKMGKADANGIQNADVVAEFKTKEEARNFVYKHNNWKL